MIHIYAVRITDFPHEQLNNVLSYLPEDRRKKHLRLHLLQDKFRGVTGDILMRMVLSSMLNRPSDELEIIPDSYGKPVLPGPGQEIGFNVSHSGDWVVLAAGSSQRIGIDIERIDEIHFDIARQFFMEEEYQSILKIQQEKFRLLQFFRIWTAKESYVKAVGKGLSIPLDSFSTIEGSAMARVKQIKGDEWYFRSYPVDNEYVLTLCADTIHICDSVKMLGIDTLLDCFLQVNEQRVMHDPGFQSEEFKQ